MNEIQKNIIEYVEKHDLDGLNEFTKKNKNLDFSFTDESGKTLLHYAVSRNSQKGLALLQKLLHEFNIDPNCVDENFQSPIDVARKMNNAAGLAILNHYIRQRQLREKSYITD